MQPHSQTVRGRLGRGWRESARAILDLLRIRKAPGNPIDNGIGIVGRNTVGKSKGTENGNEKDKAFARNTGMYKERVR